MCQFVMVLCLGYSLNSKLLIIFISLVYFGFDHTLQRLFYVFYLVFLIYIYLLLMYSYTCIM